jgi:hypothetical protein
MGQGMSFRIFFHSFAVLMFAIVGLSQAPGDSWAAPQAGPSEAHIAFQKLDHYLRNNPLEFQTSYDARNATLGNSRGTAHFFIERPNLLRIEFAGAGFSYLLVSDGSIFTIYDRKKRKYAQVPARKTPLEAMNLFTGLTAFQAQVLRFLGVVGDVADKDKDIQITANGPRNIQGRQCDRFRIVYTQGVSPDKWEVWLQQGDVPLACKTVVTSVDEGNVQTNTYVWKTSPVVLPSMFVFTPPSGSKKVDLGDLDLRPLH